MVFDGQVHLLVNSKSRSLHPQPQVFTSLFAVSVAHPLSIRGARMLMAYRSTESGDIIANSSVGKITG